MAGGVRERGPRARWFIPSVLSLVVAGPFVPARAAEPSSASGATCTRVDVLKSRRSAEKLYREGRYAEAVALLQRTKASCWSALEATDQGWLVSDLGLVALRAGQPELCRQVLAEAPASLDAGSRVAKALAYNRGLCQGDGSFAVRVYPGLLIASPQEAPDALKREWSYYVTLREGRLPQRRDREIDRCTKTDGVELRDLALTRAIDLNGVQAELLRCRALKMVTGARPSRVSHVREVLSQRTLGQVLPADLMPAISSDELETRERASREGRTWSEVDPTVRFEPNPRRPEEVQVKGNDLGGGLDWWALGDFNGDGFEDVLVIRSMRHTGGSAVDMTAFLLTRTRPEGPLTVLERME